jgi:energy-coupling factor transporter ATP-binding protein EcfA2
MRRIGYSHAFPVHFPSSSDTKTDSHDDAEITFQINGEEVTYAFRGERWTPRPRKNSHLLDSFGYPRVIYIGANAERITPRPEECTSQRVTTVEQKIIQASNRIFETDKFDDLREVSVARGRSNKAFLLRTLNKKTSQYHSEKQFSLGELCILKLIKELMACPNNSLVLIDELEMALHPRAQIKLLEYLEEVSKDRNLTVIFSTHSVSLLKAINQKQIIFLERDSENNITPIQCYPAYAIGNIALGKDPMHDVLFYVEDDCAKKILSELCKLTLENTFPSAASRPTFKVVPIGGFKEVVKFLSQSSALTAGTKAYAILDDDVRKETIVSWHNNNNYNMLKLFQDHENQIAYLPWTPEVAIALFLKVSGEASLREYYGCANIFINQSLFTNWETLPDGKEKRDKAKAIFKEVSLEITQATASQLSTVETDICKCFAVWHFIHHTEETQALLLPKLK